MLAEPMFQFTEELSKPPLTRPSLKRPSKLELKINLNEQQTALSSPQTPYDKNNNSNGLSNKNENKQDSLAVVKPVTTKKKKRRFAADMQSNRFSDVYSLTGEVLGRGAYGQVWTCRNIFSGKEFAVKIIDKFTHPNRERVFKEIEIYLHCRDCPNILKIIEFLRKKKNFLLYLKKWRVVRC